MDVSSESLPQGPPRWLLLIHQLPPKPDYVRVKVRRRLQKLGAVLFRSSVYVLPRSDAALEDFQWLANEIAGDGGDATICAVSLLSGISDDDLETLFRAERATEYLAIAESAQAIDARDPRTSEELSVLRRRLAAVSALDFFGAPEKADAERAIRGAESRLRPPDASGSEAQPSPSTLPRGAIWVSRRGVFIDRIASAWLIRRFIDPAARFRFVTASEYRHTAGELRFDMYRGEFTHVGDRCTFETLLASFSLEGDPALRAVGEIVHDIDCKDEKFGREEAAGIAAVLQGLALATDDDDQRVERGALLFDGLYGQLRRSTRS